MNGIDPNEDIARFAPERSYFKHNPNKSPGQDSYTPKWKAFQPTRTGRQTSVFYVSGVLESDIWEIGRREVALPLGKNLYGRVQIKAQVIFHERLKIVVDDRPPRHANIVGWPDDQMAEISAAQVLASQARFIEIS